MSGLPVSFLMFDSSRFYKGLVTEEVKVFSSQSQFVGKLRLREAVEILVTMCVLDTWWSRHVRDLLVVHKI
jgi:hypothetical protein